MGAPEWEASEAWDAPAHVTVVLKGKKAAGGADGLVVGEGGRTVVVPGDGGREAGPFDRVAVGKQCMEGAMEGPQSLSEVLQLAFEGVSSVALAVGLAGAGTTHTVRGSELHPGLIPLCLTRMFEDLEEAQRRSNGGYRSVVRVSYVMVSDDTVFDLLTPSDVLSEEGMLTECPWEEALAYSDETQGIEFVGMRAARVKEAYDALEHWGEGSINTYLTMRDPQQCTSVFRVYVDTVRFGEERPCRSATVDIIDCAAPNALGEDGQPCNLAVRNLCDEVSAFRDSSDGQTLPENFLRGKDALTAMLRPCLGGTSMMLGFVSLDEAEKDTAALGTMVDFAHQLRRVVNRPVRHYGVREVKPVELNPIIVGDILEIQEEGPVTTPEESDNADVSEAPGKAMRGRALWKTARGVVDSVVLSPEMQLKRLRSTLLWTSTLLNTERAKSTRLKVMLDKASASVKESAVEISAAEKANGSASGAGVEARISEALAHAAAFGKLEDGSEAKAEAVTMLARLHAIGSEGGQRRAEAEEEVDAIWKEVRALRAEVDSKAADLSHEAEVRKLTEAHELELQRLHKLGQEQANELQRLRAEITAGLGAAGKEEAAADEAEHAVESARVQLEAAQRDQSESASVGLRKVAAARARTAEAEAQLQRLKNELEALNASDPRRDDEDVSLLAEAERAAEMAQAEVKQLEERIDAARLQGDQSSNERLARAEERKRNAATELEKLRKILEDANGGFAGAGSSSVAEAEASALEAERDRVQQELAEARAAAEREEGLRVAAAKLRAEAARKRAEKMRTELVSLELEQRGSGGDAQEAEAEAEQAEAAALEIGRRLAETNSSVEGDRVRAASAHRRASDAAERRNSHGQALEGVIRDMEGELGKADKGSAQLRKAMDWIEYLQQALLRREKRILALEDLLKSSIGLLKEKEGEADALRDELESLARNLDVAEDEINERSRLEKEVSSSPRHRGRDFLDERGYANLHATGTHLQHVGPSPLRSPGSTSPQKQRAGSSRWSPTTSRASTANSPPGSVGSSGDQRPPWQTTHDLTRPHLKSGLLVTMQR